MKRNGTQQNLISQSFPSVKIVGWVKRSGTQQNHIFLLTINNLVEFSLNTNNLPNFQQWKQANGNDFSFWDYLFGVGNVEIALAFSKLFWPDFVEYHRGIFLAETFNPQICEEWKAKLENDINAVEKVMNHIHLEDILPEAEKVGIENLLYLGKIISQMWESRLKLLYPTRDFQRECNRDDSTVIVTFYQKVK